MGKVLVDFDAIGFRNMLIQMKKDTNEQYLRYNAGSLGDKMTAMSYKSMSNAFDIALEKMEDFATFEKVSSQ